jgi:hypothetical protein
MPCLLSCWPLCQVVGCHDHKLNHQRALQHYKAPCVSLQLAPRQFLSHLCLHNSQQVPVVLVHLNADHRSAGQQTVWQLADIKGTVRTCSYGRELSPISCPRVSFNAERHRVTEDRLHFFMALRSERFHGGPCASGYIDLQTNWRMVSIATYEADILFEV